jgi:hypothetical protein
VCVDDGKASKSDADVTVCVAVASESVGVGKAVELSALCHLRLLVAFKFFFQIVDSSSSSSW